MASRFPEPFRLEVRFESREDGGIRARCDKVPGFLLSNRDPDKVMADIEPALSLMLSEMFGVPMAVTRLPDIEEVRDRQVPLPAYMCASQTYLGSTNHQ